MYKVKHSLDRREDYSMPEVGDRVRVREGSTFVGRIGKITRELGEGLFKRFFVQLDGSDEEVLFQVGELTHV